MTHRESNLGRLGLLWCLSLIVSAYLSVVVRPWQVSLTLLTSGKIHILTLAFGLWSLCAMVRVLVTLNPNLKIHILYKNILIFFLTLNRWEGETKNQCRRATD